MVLDPFPGSIGGHVGGTIDTNLPYDSSNKFLLTLTSVHSYISGSGKNRSRRERAKWQDEVVAHTELSTKGTRLIFRFDVDASQFGQNAVYNKAIRDLVRVESDGMLKTLTYPMGRNIVSNAAAILIGSTFAACGWFLIVQEGQGLFGIPIRRHEMRRNNFLRFEQSSGMQTQSGGKHVMFYKVTAIDRNGGEMLIGEAFKWWGAGGSNPGPAD